MAKRALKILGLAGFLLESGCAAPFDPVRAASRVDTSQPATATGAPLPHRVVLASGSARQGRVYAVNESFYVFEANEERAQIGMLQRHEVRRVEWNGAKPADLESHDQIVLTSGHLLHGTIVEQSDLGFFRLQSAVVPVTYRVHFAQISALYRKGKKVPVP